MNIAIIGAGLSGLATAWMLLKKNPFIKISIFDSNAIGGGTSGMASGLLNLYSGATSKLNPLGLEGFKTTCQLLEIATLYMGKQVAHQQDLLRLATNDLQHKKYREASLEYADLIWMEAFETRPMIPGISNYPGIMISKNMTVNMTLYLNGLWLALEQKGVKLEIEKIEDLDQLKTFDAIVIAAGPGVKGVISNLKTPLYHNKGQILTLKWPKNIEKPTIAFNSNTYLVVDKDLDICYTGSSYERNYVDEKPDTEIAVSKILPKTTLIFKDLKNADVINCRAGIRVSCPGHLPLIEKVNNKTWVITAMGSRGLLYHGYYAEILAEKILSKL